ncbi:hypothetical protein AX15_005355 [Amanita polypyramis BW_CC]|nr:hypothetical protein AX15_005355 [Amanita polypyramis BW_CC]
MDKTTVEKQLAELQLIKCSLLPNEIMQFIDTGPNEFPWARLLDEYEMTMTLRELPTLEGTQIPPTNFCVKTDSMVGVWFEVQMPLPQHGVNDRSTTIVHVKGDYLSRAEQERWQNVIREKQSEVEGVEYPNYELLSLHLFPLLQAQYAENVNSEGQDRAEFNPKKTKMLIYHALLTSHHLISPHKRRSLQEWSSSLCLSGFAKVGYPGVIYIQGEQDSVEEFVAKVKSMQWLALRVRFVEPLEEMGSEVEGTEHPLVKKGSWEEFQKVGDVVEEMKRLGREKYVIEMGIGSARAK